MQSWKKMTASAVALATGVGLFSLTQAAPPKSAAKPVIRKVVKTEAQWKKILTPEQYNVLREAGTEPAFTGKYADFHGQGIYECAACDLKLFSSDTKFESGTGWPSFYAPLTKASVETHTDTTLGMSRTEVVCPRCGGHLGHVFDDGPKPTGLRYCMNSAALKFTAKK